MPPYFTRYAKEINDAFHYGATWTPGTNLSLGTIGVFQDGVFVPMTHLRSLGIEPQTEDDPNETQYTHTSGSGVSIEFDVGARTDTPIDVIASAKADVEISFARENALVFSARGCREHRFENVPELKGQLREELREGTWHPKWAVITHLVDAESATILFSSSDQAAVGLKARADVGAGPVELVDLSGGLSLSYARGMSQLIVAQSGLTPLFHAMRLKRGPLDRLRDIYTAAESPTEAPLPDMEYLDVPEDEMELDPEAFEMELIEAFESEAADVEIDDFEQVDFDPESTTESILETPL